MISRSRLRRALTARAATAHSEDGYVLVLVLALIVIGLGLGAAAVATTLGTRAYTTHDERSKRALQAADAGIQTELYRANQINMGSLNLTGGVSLSGILGQLLTCPVPQINASGQVIGLKFVAVASVGAPCPSNSTSGITTPGPDQEPVGNHDSFQVQFNPNPTNIGDFVELQPTIVSSGIDDNGNASDPNRQVARKVEAVLAPIMPWRTLEAGHDLSIDVPPLLSVLGLKLAGTTAFNGSAAAGNNLTIDGQASLANVFTASGISLSGGITEQSALDYCGTYTHPNMTVTLTLGSVRLPSSGCSSLVNRSPIKISATKQDCVPVGGVETCTSDAGFGSQYVAGRNSNGTVNNALTNQDEIYDTTGAAISFGPGDYVFCSFQTNGPLSLNPSGTQAVRIFIDSPSSTRCQNFVNHSSPPALFKAGAGSFVATQGEGNVLGLTHPSQAQIYVTGNGTNDGTTAYLTGGTTLSSQDMFLYAPTSNVTVTGGQTCILGTCVNTGTIAGGVIGYDVDVSGTAIVQDLGLLNYPLSSALGPFNVKQYIECTPSTTPTTTGC